MEQPARTGEGVQAAPDGFASGLPGASSFLSFWGKARPREGEAASFHPAAYHGLDVAAVCERLLELQPAAAQAFAGAAGVEAAAGRRFLVLLAALHDIGKFSIPFQAMVPQHYPPVLGPLPARVPAGHHTAVGQFLLSSPLGKDIESLAPGVSRHAWGALVSAVAGHHGRPVAGSLHEADVGAAAIAAAGAFLRETAAVFGGEPFAGRLESAAAKRLSWRIAGLMMLADWIGSNQSIFHYTAPGDSLARYLDEVARPRAAEAVARAGLRRPTFSGRSGLAALTGATWSPSPVQAFAETVDLPGNGPVLVLVEDVTGSGKTEAALVLAQRLMLAGQADGLYMALPTMATANAMYGRLAGLYRRFFAQGTPWLALAHGARHLNEAFQASILEVGCEEAPVDGDDTASAACAAWIADDRRRAFFADIGVGTIDQAFLAVLPAKYAPVRLYGLSRRVLVVDEAHAYDAYESEELSRLISFHAAQGGSTIVLSATLPETVKGRLVKAYRSGLGRGGARHVSPASYPLVTIAAGDEVATAAPGTRPDLERTVAVRRLADAEAALDAVAGAASAGAAVAYIRNTVDDALAACDALAARGLAPILFHARFAMVDRLAREGQVLETFGRESTADMRRGRVLVATQVVEQSLDLDFDVLVTDLAPVDLLIQRAGRLWRHGSRRRRPVPLPELLVVSPDPVADADADWFRRAFPKGASVYANHALLWRSAQVLFRAGAIVSPGGVRSLVEAVYGPGALDAVPQGLEGRRSAAEGKGSADKSLARMNLLDLDEGYHRGNGAWDAETRTPTRLGEERTILRLARIEAGRLSPWAPVEVPAGADAAQTRRAWQRAWALSEVSVAARRAKGRGACDPAIEAAAAAIEADWRKVGDGAVVLPLPLRSGDEEGMIPGTIAAESGAERSVAYSRCVGFVFDNA